MRTVPRTAAALVAVVLAGCATTGPTDDGAAPSPTPSPTSTASPTPMPSPTTTPSPRPPAEEAVTHDLLAFTGRQLDGGTFDGAAVTGDVLVWFWAPW